MAELHWPIPDNNASARKIEYRAWFVDGHKTSKTPYDSLLNAIYGERGAIELLQGNVSYFKNRGKCKLFAVAYKDSSAVLALVDTDWVYLVDRGVLGRSGLKSEDRLKAVCAEPGTPRMSLEEFRTSEGARAVPRAAPRQTDPLLRRKVEEAAVIVTTAYFRELNYEVDSRESDNLGWDLDAVKQGHELKLEVKGLTGRQLCVELTPNEYEKMRIHRESYRICVVTQALTEPELFVFAHAPASDQWQEQQGKCGRLRIDEVVAARCRAV